MIDLIRKITPWKRKLVEQKTDKPQKGEFIDLNMGNLRKSLA